MASDGWTHIKASPGYGMEEQWLFRPQLHPLCALKRRDITWEASLLLKSTGGVSASMLHISGDLTLHEAKAASETELQHMGWRWES